jgi:hypothetical protein
MLTRHAITQRADADGVDAACINLNASRSLAATNWSTIRPRLP